MEEMKLFCLVYSPKSDEFRLIKIYKIISVVFDERMMLLNL